jgi:hypothetical protein
MTWISGVNEFEGRECAADRPLRTVERGEAAVLRLFGGRPPQFASGMQERLDSIAGHGE